MSKKAEWLVFDYAVDDFEPSELSEHITETCQMGYEVTFPHH
jgi:glutathione peroxidase-family protein